MNGMNSTKKVAKKAKRSRKAAATKVVAKEDLFQHLSIPPKSSDLYLWCDYVEIRCLVHPDKKFSRQNLLEILAELDAFAIRQDVDEELSEGDSDELEEHAEDQDAADDEIGEDEELLEDVMPVSDRRESKVSSIYLQLDVRAKLFGEQYPFRLDSGLQEIGLRELNVGGRGLYLQLLLSASLRLISKTRRGELTSEFESISEGIFRGLMPNGWEVHPFGAKASLRYKGHLFERLKSLANDWRGDLRIKKEHLKTRNSGDGGLDLVAWHPLGEDGRVGLPIAAAQCGCTAEEWSLKQLEASPSKLAIDVLHHWATYYFMPQDLVGIIDGQFDWQRRNDLARAIVIDRLRIVRLASQFGVDGKYLVPSPAVAEATAYALA